MQSRPADASATGFARDRKKNLQELVRCGAIFVPGTQDSVVDTVMPRQSCPATIVVVDDDAEVRVVVAEFLEDFGYNVLQADGAAAAMRLLEQSPRTSLMISDIRMPDMSGLELADIVTSRYPKLKVILISGYFVAQQVNRPFLRKPFRMNDLRTAVEQQLNVG